MTIWMMSLFISEHIMQSPASDKLKYIDLSFGKKNKNMSIPAVGEFFQGDQSRNFYCDASSSLITGSRFCLLC